MRASSLIKNLMQNDVQFSTRDILSRRYLAIVFFVLLAIIGVYIWESIHLQYTQSHWDSIVLGEKEEYQESFNRNFSDYQNEVWDLAKKVSSETDLQRALRDSTAANHLPFFDILRRFADRNISLEVYDSRLEMMGWAGPSGAPVESAYFAGKDVSFILQGPLYSYLIVIIPVQDGSIAGYVVAKKMFDVSYPISNRFINNNVFASTFDAQTGMSADFDFASVENYRPEEMQNKLVIELKGVGGSLIGYASINIPLLIDRLKEIEAQENRYLRLLVVIFIALLSYLVWKISKLFTAPGVKILLVSFAIWFVRYGLIWANFPSYYVNIRVFDTAYFTSALAYGLAHSIGDLLFSSIFLFVNLLYIGAMIDTGTGSQKKTGSALIVSFGVVHLIVTVFLFFTMTRGFLSAMQSAVVDSSLHYNDPMYVFPPLRLSLMLFSLLLLGVSLVFGSMLLVRSAGLNLKNRLFPFLSAKLLWFVLAIVFFAGAYAYGWLVSNPLSGTIDRLAFVFLVLLATAMIAGLNFESKRFRTVRSAFTIMALGMFLVVYHLDNYVHDADRSKVESIAARVIRPADEYLTSVVNRALDDLSTVDSDSLSSAVPNSEIRKLAFLGWSKSILSREGYNCWVGYTNRNGEVVSDFRLGLLRSAAIEQKPEMQGGIRFVRAEEKNINGENIKIYHGYTPVFRSDGEMIGGIWVELSADKQALLTTEAPEILQNYTSNAERRFLRTLILSEYVGGKLIYTSGENIPKNRLVASDVERIGNEDGVWVNEQIDGKMYETYLSPRLENPQRKPGGSWLAVSMEVLGLQWHLFSILRILIFYVTLFAAILSAFFAVAYFRRREFTLGFRTKLLMAFIIASVLPIGILMYYDRQYAIEREETQMNNRLHQETDEVVNAMQKGGGMNAPFDLSKLQDDACGDLANDLGADFNVYAIAYLQATSQPELFTAELFDSRLSADAFTEMVIKKKSFFSEHQMIGSYTYVVGYRPLFSEAGSVFGVVSVPTLYHQREINDELMQRNAFLLGAYTLAMLIAVGMGIIFTRQISSPVIRLRKATKQIAAGDLSLRLTSGRKDEFGELENAFDKMVRELRDAQEKTIRAQREMAWKEMAKQVAHEIKNPLTPMKLSVQHLRQAYKDRVENFGEVVDKISSTLLEQIESLSRIASEFSNFARMPERRLNECLIDEVVREAMELFTHHEHIQFSNRLEAHGAALTADREEVRRMFINILQNAVQAIEGKGKIFIQTIGYGDKVEIEITDTGRGVPPELRHKLFEPNFSTKTEGMGLGLAIVKKTIDDLGGTISIESETGLGTKVKIVLKINSRS
jgi:two-component system, NtrC family, nitrogen regulation sensor histidine kinase NtrY